MKYRLNPHSVSGVPASLVGGAESPVLYPEIFFRMQPDITLACDEIEGQMRSQGLSMPTQEMVDNMVVKIHDNVCRRYPDLAAYAHEYEKNAPASANEYNISGIEIKQAGLFGGLIAFLFLAELFRRNRWRRRFY